MPALTAMAPWWSGWLPSASVEGSAREDPDREATAAGRDGTHVDLMSQQISDLTHDRQPQTKAIGRSVRLAVGPEAALDLFWRHAAASIHDLYADRAVDGFSPHPDGAGRRVLDGVANEVVEHPSQKIGTAAHSGFGGDHLEGKTFRGSGQSPTRFQATQ